MKSLIALSIVALVLAGCVASTTSASNPEGLILISEMGSATGAINIDNPSEDVTFYLDKGYDRAESKDGHTVYYLELSSDTSILHTDIDAVIIPSLTIVAVTADYKNPTVIQVPASLITEALEWQYIRWTDSGLYLYLQFKQGDTREVRIYDVAKRFNKVGTITFGMRYGIEDFSPDGTSLLVFKWDEMAAPIKHYYMASPGKQPYPLDLKGLVIFARFSPDGKKIYYPSDGSNALTNEETNCIKSYQLTGLMKGSDRTIICRDPAAYLPPANLFYGYFNWSPDGQSLAVYFNGYMPGDKQPPEWPPVKSELFICKPDRLIGPLCSKNIIPDQSTETGSLAWSNDGWLVIAGEFGQTGYFTLKADGSDMKMLRPAVSELGPVGVATAVVYSMNPIVGWLK